MGNKLPLEANMLIMAYPRVDMFEPLRAFPGLYVDMADLAMDPLLAALDQVLDDEKLVLIVWNDYVTRRPHCLTTGRRSTPVEASIRLQAVRRLYRWSYRQVQVQVKGSLALRQFTRVYGHTVPNYATLNDWECALHPSTVRLINQRVVELAVTEGVTEGKKLRTDGTVTETNIHYPTESRLLEDSVRVVGRMLSAGRELVGKRPQVSKGLFVNHTRSAKRLAREIGRAARKKGADFTPKMQKLYRKLLKTTQETLDHAHQAIPVIRRYGGLAGEGLADNLLHYLPLVGRVIDQTRRRVVQHESVPAAEKLVSLFEPHTAIIKRGKPAPRDTEFGRKIMLDEVDGGIIADYRILRGNPPEADQFQDSLDHHQDLFHHPPELVATDRGIASPHNEDAAQQAGVKHVSMPQSGRPTPDRIEHERQVWFRLAQRFRAGIEGRISVLKRARQLDRCRDKGEAGFEKWVGWGCIVNNLVNIARFILKPRRRRPAAPAA
jgi:IS5 family transposase